MHIRRFPFTARAGTIVLGIMLALGGAIPAATSQASTRRPTPTLPPAVYGSSVTTSSGTFATLAMGHLADPLNTFWQLFEEPTGSSSFTDETVALAVATNGGILLGSRGATSFEVAARPSVKLAFTPVLEHNPNNTSSWTPVAPIDKNTAAFSQYNRATIAIIGSGGAPTLVESPRPGTSWHTLATLGSLERNPSFARCAPTAMTAATFDSVGDPIIGVACANASVLGLYRLSKGSWQRLSSSDATVSGMASVLYLTSNNGTVLGIACITVGGTEHLYEISASTGTMRTSLLGVIHGPLLTQGMGATAQGGVWITYTDTHQGVTGLLTPSRTATPLTIPNISSRVATLSVRQDGTVEALSLQDGGNAMEVATLTTSRVRQWETIKTIHLAIPYSSSG